ncbi:MAG: hydrolase [Hyphomicrobium sp.]
MTDVTSKILPRAWQRMLSGRRLDLLAPSADDIDIEDIAHGLARVARWNGQTVGDHAFSVAQHVLVVEEIAVALDPQATSGARLAALLHDAPEYVIGDLISPFKTAIGLDYKLFEQQLLGAIHRRYELAFPVDAATATWIKYADRIAAYFEATVLAGFSRSEADQFFGRPAGIDEATRKKLEGLAPWPARDAQARFLDRFQILATRG